jgi:hypothetical protein
MTISTEYQYIIEGIEEPTRAQVQAIQRLGDVLLTEWDGEYFKVWTMRPLQSKIAKILKTK